ncbi:MAG: NACHT domain-containing NTPase [Candidatus Binatia bacterium]
MIGALSRRLHIRDDGTGKGREIDGTFAEFETEDAIVLLGDPGMGKTTLFRAAANANYTTVRNFLIAPNAIAGKTLFLDALDEYRAISSGQDASAEVAKALCCLKKPKFRLSCRAADWFGSVDQEALMVASPSGRVVVLELRPLSRDEILNAVQGIVSDPTGFLNEPESVGLAKLLGNPQTLELVARAWGTNKKPRNKFEAYDIGVSELLKEVNPQHVARGVASPNPCDLRNAAGAPASTLLLSNSVGISRTESADSNGYVRLPVVPYSNRSDLDAVLGRRLFSSPEVDRFELIHRTLAEFLAAEDLAKRITNGLPIDRAMALICGVDGKPVSSLRGLFAWLMCRLGHLAEGYVERDPYGVTTYGDASILPPRAQCAIWASLRRIRDPWFLASEEDRGAFRNLANLNTATIIHEILQNPATGVHLKIAALEAIANSSENIGLNAILRAMVLEKHDNTWMRRTALRAFSQSVQNDWTQLEALDCELAQATDDLAAPEVRVELLRLTPTCGSVAQRALSILEQTASTEEERNTFSLYPLIALLSDIDLEVVLDDASRVLIPKSGYHFQLRLLFDEYLKQRLESPAPITPVQLASWLRNVHVGQDHHSEKTLVSLKARLEREPALFEEVFNLLVHGIPNKGQSFWAFVASDLWHLLPATVWPVPHCEFFLTWAEKDKDPEHAADFFRMYLAWFPSEGASVALAEAGFALLARRPDVAKLLGDWNICEIEQWRKDQLERREEENRQHEVNRDNSIAYFTPRLMTIREGRDENALAWEAQVYLGFFNDLKDIIDARARLVYWTNDEIADALIEGFIRYAENPTIPKKEAVLESLLANSIPYIHTLLSLSVFLRLTAGMTVPEEALPHCIAAVVSILNISNKIPGFNETLSEWILQEAHQHPDVVKAVLTEMWLALTAVKEKNLPGFYALSHDPGSQQFLASLSADVLKFGINEDSDTVGKLVSVLLRHDQQAALTLGTTEIARSGLSAEVRAIWSTALFVIDPSTYSELWRTLISAPDTALWEAIAVLGSSLHKMREAVRLTAAQRAEVIALVGQRFANIAPLPEGWGDQNPWDASQFVANQIKLLAADSSPDVDAQFERLENDGGLACYRNVIRHYRAQHEKQRRESHFTFASPERVAEALWNRFPATPSDLLAFIVDHLNVLGRELTGTQRERYRAYWNESELKLLIKPKHEESCSGLLAEDLQHRVQAQGLIVTVEHHMIADKECDLVVLQGTERLLPIEVKHHYHTNLWTAWHTQLDRLYTRDAKADGLGIYLVLWSGEAKGRKIPKLPNGIKRPASAAELRNAIESLIPEGDRHRLRVVVVDILPP